jgi:hypothetical protein
MRSAVHIAVRALAIATLMALAAEGPAQSLGVRHVPSSWCQYLGCGYGPGRHAPMVHTPWQRPPRPPRMIYVRRSEGPLWPAAYESLPCYGPECFGGWPGEYGPEARRPTIAPPPIGPPASAPPTISSTSIEPTATAPPAIAPSALAPPPAIPSPAEAQVNPWIGPPPIARDAARFAAP